MSEKRVSHPVDRYDGIEPSNTWTEGEKRVLLSGLKKYGHKDVLSIAKILPSKSAAAIRTMIGNLMMAASRSNNHYRTPPIDMWLEQASLDDTNGLIPQALLFISLFERHEAPENCDGCDWRAAYDYIYRVTQGHPALELPKRTRKTVYKAISKTVSKTRLRSSQNHIKFTNNLYKSSPQKDYTRKSKMPQKIGPYKILQELNTFSVPSDQLRIP